MAKRKSARQLRGQLMLQIAAGRFFRPGVPLNETEHRYTVYSNARFIGDPPIALPVGEVIASTEMGHTSSAMIAVVDRLEQQRPDGTDDFMIATGGTDLVDDLAYLMTFVLNRTVSRNHDQTRRLVTGDGAPRGRSANDLFPELFEPRQTVQPHQWEDLRQFMNGLLDLSQDDFARVMRVIRNSVDATRRALDDPTGAYTDLVAALESISDDKLSTPATWDRYDGSKRKIIDAALIDAGQEVADRVRAAVLEADRAGLKRRFISSTLARLSPDYYRDNAAGSIRPPRAPDLERMLGIAYDIRSRRSHVLEDLGEGVWVYTDGAETAYEPSFERVLTLAGLWRLIRHVVRQYVSNAEKVAPEPWDYRNALPGIVEVQLAPQYWIWQPGGLTATTATRLLDGFAEALIGWIAGQHTDGIPLDQVCREIEDLVPTLPDGESKTSLIATHVLWHAWISPADHRSEAATFIDEYKAVLDAPSASAVTVSLLSDHSMPTWSANDWAAMAQARNGARHTKSQAPLPAAIDVLIQLIAADELEAAGRHDEAVVFAAKAVGELPGNDALLAWEARLVAGNHDPDFDVHTFLFGEREGEASRETSEDEQPGDSSTEHREAAGVQP
ncbi:hypothetical protein [Rhodococcus sp. SORGH_AS_0301]|uniref:hypothetical protein n=1 Tax=Rhodococcus sp. SORGH_AS_0301 TaxID=3041780 RepID=UPI0027851A25|nr:hypothetical protein [Rhodococcus sp. SORGH_AS_0301]MDQ1178656.1 AcrR family transcriptional regulator [Rhodococcus sp. SORGH_AS_0301]